MNPDLIATVSAAAALVGAGVAIWQAVSARRDRKAAQVSSADAAARAAEAQASWSRMANAQEAIAEAQRPSAWGESRHAGGDLWTVRNSSGRPITVVDVVTTPRNAGPLLRVEPKLPARVAAGKFLDLFASPRLGLAVRRVRIVWRFSDQDATHNTDRDLIW